MKDFLAKLGSGRLFLVICTGLVFLYCSINKILGADVISTICTAVFLSYFSRTDRNGSNPPSK